MKYISGAESISSASSRAVYRIIIQLHHKIEKKNNEDGENFKDETVEVEVGESSALVQSVPNLFPVFPNLGPVLQLWPIRDYVSE